MYSPFALAADFEAFAPFRPFGIMIAPPTTQTEKDRSEIRQGQTTPKGWGAKPPT
jgi:hypothetical protein